MGLLLSIIVGGIVGWIASIAIKTDSQQSIVFYILVGIVGSVVLGWIMSIIGKNSWAGFNLFSFLVALIGAVVLIVIAKRRGGYDNFKTKIKFK
jgi:uncharacterized membrane protein YeaQ/YmgE (transglycosylase-associated protein family)